ncbi:hypothetical protein GGS20DRAFT_523035 [Poronia punctata]|nr:hypothetical protein GGS20DRAFT_523035 [Poronia punctata]
MSSSGHDDEPSPEKSERILVGPVGATPPNQNRRVKKKRVRNFTEDDRAAHRIFEKSRREAFKEALTNLASLLPALADTEPQRLSKHVVVDESITFIKSQQERISTVTDHLEAVKKERDQLMAELNQWRGGAGIETRQVAGINQAAVHHSDASVGSDTIMGAVPTTLRSVNPPIPIIGEAAPPFVSSAPNPAALPPDASVSGLPWESFDSRIHNYETHTNHTQQAESRPDNSMGSPGSVQIASYQTSRSPPNLPQFNTAHEHHDPVFMPFQTQPSFNPGSFQGAPFMQNPLPLQDYIPP